MRFLLGNDGNETRGPIREDWDLKRIHEPDVFMLILLQVGLFFLFLTIKGVRESQLHKVPDIGVKPHDPSHGSEDDVKDFLERFHHKSFSLFLLILQQ